MVKPTQTGSHSGAQEFSRDAFEQRLNAWDGKSKADIQQVFKDFSNQGSFVKWILDAMSVLPLAPGATWLLKRYLETGGTLNAKEVSQVYRCLLSWPESDEWESRLHVFQSMEWLPINKSWAKKLAPFLTHHLTHPNKFLRAWAYHGYYHLARQHIEFREPWWQFKALAERDEAASVKARIRNLGDF
mgnify:FL=1